MNETTRHPKTHHVPGRKVCATCLRVLDHHSEKGWTHPEADPTLQDHEVRPVPDIEMIGIAEKCDFCFADETEWILPARDFQVGPNHGSEGDWAACNQCAELIRKNMWTRLIERVKDTWPHQYGDPISDDGELWLRRTYRKLRLNITGDLRRIGDADPEPEDETCGGR